MLLVPPPFRLDYLVLQPTTLCNLNCEYCYLPNRKVNERMPLEVAEALADYIARIGHHFQLIWHGGEPTACGVEYFESLLQPFERPEVRQYVTQCLQTNGTLLDDAWCELFEKYDVKVGVSIDGHSALNARRVDWAGRPAFERTLRGITTLKARSIEFSTISVVGNNSLGGAGELYGFLKTLAPNVIGINIEECEGINLLGVRDDPHVVKFWADLVGAWKADPQVRVREFNFMIPNLLRGLKTNNVGRELVIDLFPSVSVSGDVVLLSPEFVDAKCDQYGDFVVGNLLHDSLYDILSGAIDIPYVRAYLDGIDQCKRTCEYFEFCGGGQASNKYFEHGRLDATETAYCRNTVKSLADGLLAAL